MTRIMKLLLPFLVLASCLATNPLAGRRFVQTYNYHGTRGFSVTNNRPTVYHRNAYSKPKVVHRKYQRSNVYYKPLTQQPANSKNTQSSYSWTPISNKPVRRTYHNTVSYSRPGSTVSNGNVYYKPLPVTSTTTFKKPVVHSSDNEYYYKPLPVTSTTTYKKPVHSENEYYYKPLPVTHKMHENVYYKPVESTGHKTSSSSSYQPVSGQSGNTYYKPVESVGGHSSASYQPVSGQMDSQNGNVYYKPVETVGPVSSYQPVYQPQMNSPPQRGNVYYKPVESDFTSYQPDCPDDTEQGKYYYKPVEQPVSNYGSAYYTYDPPKPVNPFPQPIYHGVRKSLPPMPNIYYKPIEPAAVEKQRDSMDMEKEIPKQDPTENVIEGEQALFESGQFLDFSSGQAEVLAEGEEPLVPETIDLEAVSEADFSILKMVVEETKLLQGLERVVGKDQPITIFAPSDQAFRKALPGGSLNSLPKAILQKVLLRHVLIGTHPSESFQNGPITTAGSEQVLVQVDPSGSISLQYQDTPVVNVVATDIETSIGLVHVVDGLLGKASA